MQAIAAHISSQFKRGSSDKARFVDAGQRFLESGWVDAATVRNINVTDGPEVTLTGQAHGGRAGDIPVVVRTQWVKDADGEWRMAGFTVHRILGDADPLTIPDLDN
jgi:hypothetical protein